jgi:hypothetical protein
MQLIDSLQLSLLALFQRRTAPLRPPRPPPCGVTCCQRNLHINTRAFSAPQLLPALFVAHPAVVCFATRARRPRGRCRRRRRAPFCGGTNAASSKAAPSRLPSSSAFCVSVLRRGRRRQCAPWRPLPCASRCQLARRRPARRRGAARAPALLRRAAAPAASVRVAAPAPRLLFAPARSSARSRRRRAPATSAHGARRRRSARCWRPRCWCGRAAAPV